MKSLAELAALREKTLAQIQMRSDANDSIKVVVGMAECGIAAGAKAVLNTFLEEVGKRELRNVIVMQSDCIGLCRLEPIVEVYLPGKEKVTYGKVTPAQAVEIVDDHIVNGNVVRAYTIGEIDK